MYLKEQDAFKCLKYIRIAPGKVYEYELGNLIANNKYNEDNRVDFTKEINTIFGLEILKFDELESLNIGDGLNVIYTNPQYRIIVDILLSEQEYELNKSVYIDGVEEKILESNKIEVTFSFATVKKELYNLKKQNPGNRHVEEAEKIFENKWENKKQYNILTIDDIADMIKENSNKTIDLKNSYIKDFSYKSLKDKIGGDSLVLHKFDARESFFSGENLDFQDACFEGGVSFKESIFNGRRISFYNAKFSIEKDKDLALDYANNEISFRNTRILAQDIYMNNIQVLGDEKGKCLSFEDAVIDCRYIHFSKSKFGDVKIYFYQTIMKHTCIRFIEAETSDGELEFEDSIVESLIFLNCKHVCKSNFCFRECNRLIINNDDSENDKAQQFILLKENFSGLGEYDYEDEAFVLYMNYREKSKLVGGAYEILRRIGDYGVSPKKVVLTMVYTCIVFAILNCSIAILYPSAFDFSGDIVHIIVNAFYLSVSNLVSYSANIHPIKGITIMISLLQSIIGWFLLGYLSISIVRKTLR